jgi:hypothetical protein
VILPCQRRLSMTTHELIINGKPFSGCFVMALKNTFGRFDHLHILYRQYYHKGKLVWRDTVSAFNLDSGEQEVTYD